MPTFDLERTLRANICPSSESFTLYTFPNAPLLISSNTWNLFSLIEAVSGNSGRKYDSSWDTGQAVLLDL